MKPVKSISIEALLAGELDAYSRVIDVRSPAEFADDHIPGAVNYPALDDDERAQVGTLYKQVNPFEARKLGASLMGKRVAEHLAKHLADEPKEFSPLLYCWRGGQRSNSFAMFLAQIGWQVTVLEGGYKAYRRAVMEAVDDLPDRLKFVVLGGATGTGKTAVLHALTRAGGQVLDLEGLARHRGSVLGKEPGLEAPSQRWFETEIAARLRGFDPTRPVFVESESAKVGTVYQPRALWRRLAQARYVALDAARGARAQAIVGGYSHWAEQPEKLKSTVGALVGRLGHATIAELNELIDGDRRTEFVELLLERHYDPSYTSARKRHFQTPSARIEVDPNSDESHAAVARTLLNSYDEGQLAAAVG